MDQCHGAYTLLDPVNVAVAVKEAVYLRKLLYEVNCYKGEGSQ